MTTARIPVEQIADHADHVRPGVVIATAITAVFFALGWTFGATWRGIVYCCLAVRYGYRTGAHVPVKTTETPGT